MTQHEIDRAVSAATGETVAEIKHLGFGLADPDVVSFDPEPEHLEDKFIDWDAADDERYALLPC